MMKKAQPTAMQVPFPALTPGARLHLEVHGYAVVPDLLTRDECDWIKDDLYRLRSDLRKKGRGATPGPGTRAEGPMIDHAYFAQDDPHHTYLGSLGQSRGYPGILHYLSHPRVLGLAEELIGGDCQ
jgi:hypothetical protein